MSTTPANPASRPLRRFLRFSVRGMIVLVLLIGCWSGWLVRSARIQREAVAATLVGGSVIHRSVLAQEPGGSSGKYLGWDLSYEAVLKKNEVGRDAWIRKWLAEERGPEGRKLVERMISGWRKGPIESSALVEFPAGHAGELCVCWFVRTKEHAYQLSFAVRARGGDAEVTEEPLPTADYDAIFAHVRAKRQGKPLPREKVGPGIPLGYSSLMSVYDHGKSRQLLLAHDEEWGDEK